MLPVKTYPFQVPANGSYVLQATGRYVRVNSESAGLLVTIDGVGTLSGIGAGQGLRLRDTDPPFQRLVFTDTSGANNNVSIVVADSDFVDNTVLGTVNVVDGGKARTLANQMGMWAAQPGASAGNDMSVLLWNPAGSGKNIIIDRLWLSSTTSQIIYGGWTTGDPGGGKATPASMLVGTAFTGVAKATSGPSTHGSEANLGKLGQWAVTANQPTPIQLQEPFVIPPNQSLQFVTGTAGADITVVAPFYEEAVQ